MFIKDSLTREEIDFIMEMSDSKYHADKFIIIRLKAWDESALLKAYGKELTDYLLENKNRLLEEHLKINDILFKCIGGFSYFVNFKDNGLKFYLNYNFKKEGLPFIGSDILSFTRFKKLEGEEMPYLKIFSA